ncbi:MAG: TonB-dependent receptor [Proteobacteria bacterium]|nr:TonB-dependent receptor [Pseudomonadota bacterium]MBS0218120.1 TonB-dependent receptor [Pseudomonadota bacterium]
MTYQRVRFARHHALAAALALCFAGNLSAQSNVTGSIFGTAESGATISVENKDTGLVRRISADQNGRYLISALPNGTYKVTEEKNGATIATRDNISVNIASGTEVSFASAARTNDLGTVTVTATGAAGIDVTQTDTRTVLTADQLGKISVARDVSSAALLAPSVVFSDSYKQANGTTIPSFGGSASSENAYFINGFNVTNPFNSLGFASLPFDAIQQQQVLTGGYGAEFGRSTGGVINIVTKRGGNKWKGGVYTTWAPSGTRSQARSYYYGNTGRLPATDGTLYQYRGQDSSWNTNLGAYVSGPIIKNRLFVYANLETTREEGNNVTSIRLDSPTGANGRSGWKEYQRNTPRSLIKLDWNINDSHTIEFTGLGENAKNQTDGYAFNYNGYVHGSQKNTSTITEDRTRLYVGKYTGVLTDSLTLSASYGQLKTTHDYNLMGYNPNCPAITVGTSPNARAPGIPSGNYDGGATCQPYSGLAFVPGEQRFDKSKGGRLDINWRIGKHDLRFGYDRQDSTSYTNQQLLGGYQWSYLKAANPATNLATDGSIGSPAAGGGVYGAQGYYVTKSYSNRQANLRTVQASQFIEDRWQVSDNVLLSLGLRNEQFTNYDAAGKQYIKQSKQIAPRIGATWDVYGDSRLKVFGNAGRYHLALPSSAAQRAQARITTEYYTYDGVNADGTPFGLHDIPLDASKGTVCAGTNWVSSNQECGKARDPRTETSKNIKSHYQDEFIIGFEAALTPTVNFGVKGTYRVLRSAIDDVCSPLINYGRCTNFNPGVTNTFESQDRNGNFTTITLTREQMGFPKLKRKYQALDFFVEHAYANKWYGKFEYTFSRSTGNTEGQLSSELDTGAGGQIDVSRTQDWDKPGLMDNSYGMLPNDRRHQLKAYGYVQLFPEWRVGATWMWASGRPQSCLSYHPDPKADTYQSSTNFFCGLVAFGNAVPMGRGTYGKVPPSNQLNLNLAYTPNWAGKKLTVQADVFNVLNRQSPAMYYPRYASGTSTMNALFGREMYYSSPRYLRLTARYDF